MARQALVAAFAAVLWTATSFAHHPFSDEFDASKTITLTGTVTQVEWTNPHVFAYLDVKDSQGRPVGWKVEMGSPSSLEMAGWTRASVKPGDQVTIKGWAARNNTKLVNAESFTLSSGKTMAAASSYTADQQARGTAGADTEGLPATASPLALYLTIGALSLLGALGLRALRQ